MLLIVVMLQSSVQAIEVQCAPVLTLSWQQCMYNSVQLQLYETVLMPECTAMFANHAGCRTWRVTL
jgi:hypothetical protein